MKYHFMGQQEQYATALQCRVLGVSVSGYYAWCQRNREDPVSRRAQGNRQLLVQIRTIFEQHRRRYGSPRIYQELQAAGVKCSRKRVARLMRQEQLWACRARRYRKTTDSKHSHPVAANLLDRRFAVQEIKAVNRAWAGDITYISTTEGWMYLAVLLDLYSRRVIGWAMDSSLGEELVQRALKMALANRQPPAGVLHHSDRGCQYAAQQYQSRLAESGLVCSMSGKGDCWDNAPVESFFATLKKELIHQRHYASREEARLEVFEFIEVYYNRQRRHSTLGYLSPSEFEDKSSSQSSQIRLVA
jgi:putative transposase